MTDTRTRVLVIVKGLDIGRVDGGRDRFGIDLARYLDRQRFDIDLCVFWYRDSIAESHWLDVLRRDGVNVFFAVRSGGRCDWKAYLAGIRTVLEFCYSSNVDIIHSHYHVGTLCAMLAKGLGRAKVALRTVHTSSLDHGEWDASVRGWIARHVLTNWIFPLLLDAEIGVSQDGVRQMARLWAHRLFRKRVYLVHNAIHIGTGDALTETTYGQRSHQQERYCVGSVGRLTKQKGYIYLVEAAPLVLGRLPRVEFLVVGDGELRKPLQQRTIQLGVQDSLQFIGLSDDVASRLKHMDLFVLPSLWEGLPTVALESMAAGVPIIATDIPGNSELIQHSINGWLIPPQNAKDLAQAIVYLLQNQHVRLRLAREAKMRVREFSIESIAERQANLYRKLLSLSMKG